MPKEKSALWIYSYNQLFIFCLHPTCHFRDNWKRADVLGLGLCVSDQLLLKWCWETARKLPVVVEGLTEVDPARLTGSHDNF